VLDDGGEVDALVWLVDGDGTICYSRNGTAHKLTAQYMILAPGTLSRRTTEPAPIFEDEIPDIQITSALGLEHAWDREQRFWYPRHDEGLASQYARIYLAGGVTGRKGAAVARWQGRRAALAIAMHLGHDVSQHDLPDCPPAEPGPAPVLDPATLDDAAMVCPCEGVSAGDIRRLAAQGCETVNQAKALGRPGMGSCQGRRCGLLVEEGLADCQGVDMPAVGYFRQRWPTSPVPLAQLSKFAHEEI
jgi:bacterioferritin-associated ferredoxin